MSLFIKKDALHFCCIDILHEIEKAWSYYNLLYCVKTAIHESCIATAKKEYLKKPFMKVALLQNIVVKLWKGSFYTRKLGEILVFCAVY